jgi:hypothetical protein
VADGDDKPLETQPISDEAKPAESPVKVGSKPFRDAKGRLLKGAPVLNPGGRPRGLAARLRAETKDGQQIIDVFKKIALGQLRATTRDRLDAARWIAERMWGKTPDVVITGTMSPEQQAIASELTREQLLSLASATGRLPASAETVDAEVVVVSNEPTDK